ncbi:MAG: TIGR04282 family arsenosugar biosynthesis glycosyltransferase [Planctomycetaceae bacterium]|nr:TIGR04282 family arsenosugar biosynthesis glycosyltransferase [Planctomycetaceae bacterium]
MQPAEGILGIFVKAPISGQVKTRLGNAIGMDLAARFADVFQQDLLEQTQAVARRRVIAFSPGTEQAHSHFQNFALASDQLWKQPEASLGDRLIPFFEAFVKEGRPVLVIGSDSPSLPVDRITEAFQRLHSHDVVVGPATDGGYYLIGMNQPNSELFTNIEWSSPRVLEQTVQRVRTLGLSLSLLTPWYDVDTIDDLRMLQGHLAALKLGGHPIPRRTEALLREFSPLEVRDR